MISLSAVQWPEIHAVLLMYSNILGFEESSGPLWYRNLIRASSECSYAYSLNVLQMLHDLYFTV